ncbi:hypothetical protein ACGFJT_40370 [Actinomadura geliboluensis]|uniref:hypothetical protein n=1 Tax=Actinomadura geliboluensis TaxID=882440 RepID=UPI00372227C3
MTGSLQSSLEEAKHLRAALVTAQAAEKAVRDQAATMAAELRQQRLRAEEVTAERAAALQDASRARAEARAEHTARVKAEQQARDARDQIKDALLQRDRALESTRSAHERLDQTRTALAEQQAEAAQQARLAGELQGKVSMLIAERDAARTEAERARRSIDQFITDQRRGAEAAEGVQHLRAIDPQTAGRQEGAGQPDGTVSILHRRPPAGTGPPPAAAADH